MELYDLYDAACELSAALANLSVETWTLDPALSDQVFEAAMLVDAAVNPVGDFLYGPH